MWMIYPCFSLCPLQIFDEILGKMEEGGVRYCLNIEPLTCLYTTSPSNMIQILGSWLGNLRILFTKYFLYFLDTFPLCLRDEEECEQSTSQTDCSVQPEGAAAA